MKQGINNELVRYSRAGDVFHYRWAARRCLKMIYPTSRVRYIIIEGSNERHLAGEYVIDVSEYLESENDKKQEINYYQLKHTTVRGEQPFTLSELKDTICGFSKRYQDFSNKKEEYKIRFYLITNRPIVGTLKANIKKLVKGNCSNKRFNAFLYLETLKPPR